MPPASSSAPESGQPHAAAHGDLLPEHVEAVFTEFLGRAASPADVEIWMGVGSLRGLMDGVLASEEYAARVAERVAAERSMAQGPFVNVWSAPLAGFCHPPGTLSPDGVAIVGEQGHLFLYGGSNNNLAMFRGDLPMAPDWAAQWAALVQERSAQARADGRGLCCLIVPDKLAVYADLLGQDLGEGPRPVRRLLGGGPVEALLYPCDALAGAREGGDSYLMTDSHLTNRGNRLLAELTIDALGGAPSLLEPLLGEEHHALVGGDLGMHFDPPILEVRGHLAQPSAATIVADNWPVVMASGGHIGTVRVFRRDDAPDPRTVVVFGDSYGFGDDAYRGLSWFLAQAFREVHFVWVPFGWDREYLERVGAELVVCQTAERFLVRVPRRSVDVSSLSRASGGGQRALGLERAFDDVAAG